MNCIFFWLHSSRGTGCHFVLGSFWLKPNLEEQDDSEVFFKYRKLWHTKMMSNLCNGETLPLHPWNWFPFWAKLDVNGVPKIGYAWLVPQKHHDANDPTPIQQLFWDMPLEKDVQCFEIHVYIYISISLNQLNSFQSRTSTTSTITILHLCKCTGSGQWCAHWCAVTCLDSGGRYNQSCGIRNLGIVSTSPKSTEIEKSIIKH